MTRITADPEHLQTLANALRKHGSDLQARAEQLNGIVNGLATAESKQLNISAEWEQAHTLARALAGQAEDLSASLSRKARRLAEADQDGASSMAQVFSQFEDVLSQAPAGWLPGAYTPAVPHNLISRVSSLGASEAAVLPATALTGLAALLGVKAVVKTRGDNSPAHESEWNEQIDQAAQSVSPARETKADSAD